MKDILFYLISPELHHKLFPLKILFLLFSLFLLGFIIYLLRITDWLKYYRGQDAQEFKSFRAAETVAFLKKWKKTKSRLAKGWESEAKLALIEADSLLNEVLKRMGYAGENLDERLKQFDKNTLPNIDEVWEAHRIRNDIVHDPDYKISVDKVKELIQVYEKAFEHLEAL